MNDIQQFIRQNLGSAVPNTLYVLTITKTQKQQQQNQQQQQQQQQ